MKKRNHIILFLLAPFILVFTSDRAAGQEDPVEAKEIVRLRYFNDNNKVQYLLLESQLKKGSKVEPIAGKTFNIYLDSTSDDNLVSELKTDNTGKAKTFIPASFKTAWEQSSIHKFIAVVPGKDETIELDITKARIQVDTLFEDGVRSVTVNVQKYENGEWQPANEVEMRIGVNRLGGGILSINDEASFTTDSTGIITTEYNRVDLPGDQAGNITLIAKVDDNDLYGNLKVEKTVPWGGKVKADESFFEKRSLWSTRFKTPIWLLTMAGSIVIGVWATIGFLVWQIVRIKRLGSANTSDKSEGINS